MADRNTPASFTFEEWRVEFNELAVDVGDIANLPATITGVAVTDAFEAIKELNTSIGTTGFDIAADSGTAETVVIGNTITFSGTTNEIETSVSATDTIQIGLPDDVTVTNDLNVGGNLDVTGNITLGGNITMGDADTDSIDFNADIVSNIIPNTASTYDLGASGKEWQNIYMTGSLNNDSGTSLTFPTNSGAIATEGFSVAMGIALG
jgi:hypothetical protein